MVSGFRAALRRTWTAVPVRAWAIIAALFVGVVWTSYYNYTEWISDSRYYLAWTYRYLGVPELEAARMIKDYLFDMPGHRGCSFCWDPGWEYDLFHGEGGAVTGPRVVYSILSAPFVKFFGPTGMLVLPLLSYAVAVVVLVVLTSRLLGKGWALAAGVLILLPTVETRFATYAMTETPAMMFNLLGLLFLPLRRETRRRDVVWFSVTLLLCLFTRQFAITIPAGLMLAWFVVAIRDRRARNPWLPFAVSATAITGFVIWLQGYISVNVLDGNSLSPITRYQQMTAKYFDGTGFDLIPKVIANMVRVDFNWVTRREVIIVALVVVAFAASAWRYRSELSALLVGTSALTAVLTVAIVEPTFFRYFVPLVPLMVLSVLALLSDLFATPRRRPSRSVEAMAAEPSATSGELSTEAAPRRDWTRLAGLSPALWSITVVAYASTLFVLFNRGGLKMSIVALLIFSGTVLAFVVLAAQRLGPAPGLVAGWALMLSSTVVGRGVISKREAIALAAVVACLALLPGGVADRFRTWAAPAFGALLGVALVVNHRAIVLAVGVGVVWLLSAVRDRSWRNLWTPYGLLAAGLGLLTLAVDLIRPWRGASYRKSWLTRGPELSEVFDRIGSTLSWQVRLTARDQVVFAICLIALVALVFAWRNEWAWLTGAMLACGVILLLIDGRVDEFRNFQLVYPAMVILAVQVLGETVARPLRMGDAPTLISDHQERIGRIDLAGPVRA